MGSKYSGCYSSKEETEFSHQTTPDPSVHDCIERHSFPEIGANMNESLPRMSKVPRRINVVPWRPSIHESEEIGGT